VATTRRRVNGKVYETHLLRRTYREGGKVKHQTLGRISHLSPDLVETARRRLRGELAPGGTGGFRILRAWLHGHVAAALAGGSSEALLVLTVERDGRCSVPSRRWRKSPHQALLRARAQLPLAASRGIALAQVCHFGAEITDSRTPQEA